MNVSRDTLYVRLGHVFGDSQLLESALTHRSYHFENRATSGGHFERLEFLGDAVLGLIVSELLMRNYPEADEGALSKWRASLVNETTLSEIARSIDLGGHINLGRGEAEQRGNLRPRLLASAFEAVLAALYLDGGVEKVQAFIARELQDKLKELSSSNEYAADFKTRLQEWSQKKYRSVPEYKLLGSEGPDHAKTFRCEVSVTGRLMGQGQGSSRKIAEQEAAKAALALLEEGESK